MYAISIFSGAMYSPCNVDQFHYLHLTVIFILYDIKKNWKATNVNEQNSYICSQVKMAQIPASRRIMYSSV